MSRNTTLRELFDELIEACVTSQAAVNSCDDMAEGGLTDAGDTWFGMSFAPTLVEDAREKLDAVLAKVNGGWTDLMEKNDDA